MMRNRLRWLPAVAVPALIAVGVMGAGASGDIQLPERSAAEVFVMVAEHPDSFSGTVEQTSEFGLPELPTGGTDAPPEASDLLEWLSGSHSVRVFVDGPQKARLQVLDRHAERDVIMNGSDVWVYDSREKTAHHAVLPADRECEHGAGAMKFQPTWLAEQLLGKLDASTELTLGPNLTVAGRAAYDLVLTPTTPDTLVGSISVAVDGETGMPLSVRVQARGQDEPAISVGFTEVTLETPDAALFEFTPPEGTDVSEHWVDDADSGLDKPEKSDLPRHGDKPELTEPELAEPPDPIISGSDWTSVVELPAGSAPAELVTSPRYAQLTTAVDGGRLVSTSLVNILITGDGRVFAGAVPVHLLQAAVTTP